ncbi:MAG TPA: hypothetical protein PK585_05170 [Amphiplicatus sp.]|nr:hypothetical protein [Amphiplicatus sp.]
MAEREVLNVKLVKGGLENFSGLFWVIAMGFFWWLIFQPMRENFTKPEPDPYLHDLRGEGAPVEMNFDNPWSVMVTVNRPDGDEIRFFDVKTGKLEGTYLVPASAEAASDESESGAE